MQTNLKFNKRFSKNYLRTADEKSFKKPKIFVTLVLISFKCNEFLKLTAAPMPSFTRHTVKDGIGIQTEVKLVPTFN